MKCLGAARLAGILARIVRDPRHTTGGMPDLVVWNPQTGVVKVCALLTKRDLAL